MNITKLLLILSLAVFAGCMGRRAPVPVDPEKARTALTTALDSWKKNTSLEAMTSQSPSVLVQDVDWEGGMKLVSYKILSPGKEEDMHLRCPVELVVRDLQGREQRKTVRYTITTSPNVAVFREVFP